MTNAEIAGLLEQLQHHMLMLWPSSKPTRPQSMRPTGSTTYSSIVPLVRRSLVLAIRRVPLNWCALDSMTMLMSRPYSTSALSPSRGAVMPPQPWKG